MGQKDTITKRYMSKPEYFADAFNYFVFGGEQIIRPENLVEQDPVEIGIIPLELYDSKDNEMVQKFRDVLKECVLMQDEKVAYLLLGIENQSDVHYAMPVRNMVYDALNYGKQVSDIARKHRLHGESGHSRAEYLSGFHKTDVLKPVITLTIFWNKKGWDVPRSLHEMFRNIEPQVLEYVDNYKLNLIVPKEIKDFDRFQSDLGKVMKYISVADQKAGYREASQDEKYRMLNRESAEVLNACIDAKITFDTEQEVVDMCKAVESFIQEGKAEGLAEGKAEGKAEGIAENQKNNVTGLLKQGILTIEQIAEGLEIPLEEVLKIKEEISSQN